MVSFGSKKSKSKSSSSTVFPRDFFEQAYDFFGGEPEYAPDYIGFKGGPELEKSLYGSQESKLTNAYNEQLGRQREELSQSGLLTSPSQYIEGGARDVLNKGYLNALQQAAYSAAQQRLETERGEAARETGFNVDRAKTLLQAFLNKLGIATSAGRTSTGSSSEGGFNFGLTLPKLPE